MPDTVAPASTQTDFEQWAALPEDQQGITDETPAETTEPEAAPETPADDAEGETDPESAPEEDQDAEPEAEETPKGLKKRFRKLNGRIRDLETQLAQREPVKEVKQEVATPQPKQTDAQAPQPGDFETYEDFTRANIRYELAQERAKEQAQARQTARQAQEKARQDAWKQRVSEAKTRNPDYEDVLTDATGVVVTPAMHEAIMDSEIGPDLVYHLAQHPAESQRIAKLGTTAAIREMGKLEAKLAPATTPETKPAVSKAPKPPKPVGGPTAAQDLGKEPDPKDFTKWSKWKDRQDALANS